MEQGVGARYAQSFSFRSHVSVMQRGNKVALELRVLLSFPGQVIDWIGLNFDTVEPMARH